MISSSVALLLLRRERPNDFLVFLRIGGRRRPQPLPKGQRQTARRQAKGGRAGRVQGRRAHRAGSASAVFRCARSAPARKGPRRGRISRKKMPRHGGPGHEDEVLMAKRMLLISLFPASVAILASSSAAFALLCSAPQPRRTCTSSCVLRAQAQLVWPRNPILRSMLLRQARNALEL